MKTIPIENLAQQAADLLQLVESGEICVLSRGGRPVVELRPIGSAKATPRPFGLAAGEFSVPDDFDAPLPADVQGDFDSSCDS